MTALAVNVIVISHCMHTCKYQLVVNDNAITQRQSSPEMFVFIVSASGVNIYLQMTCD